MSVKIEIQGIEEFKRTMQEKQNKIKNELPKSVQKATLYIHSKVKESIARGVNAPTAVDTGRFLNSVDFETTGENQAKVFTNLSYAQYIEYGTKKMAARPHFHNTAIVEANNVKEVMKSEIS